jgi:hypothetical protein
VPRYFLCCFTCFVVLSLYEVICYAYSLFPLFSYFVNTMGRACVMLIWALQVSSFYGEKTIIYVVVPKNAGI